MLFYANGSKEKNGTIPIMGRVTINGTVAQFSCKRSISKELWDAKGNRAKGKSVGARWKSHATLTLLAKQDLPTFGYNMIDPLKSWCWGSILFYPFKISRFS